MDKYYEEMRELLVTIDGSQEEIKKLQMGVKSAQSKVIDRLIEDRNFHLLSVNWSRLRREVKRNT